MEHDCTQAGIEPHWCTCLDWTTVPRTDPIVQFMADNFVETINNETESQRELCSKLNLSKIGNVTKYVPRSALMQFLGSIDRHGDKPNLSASPSAQLEYYEMDIWTNPGDAHYQAQVTWDKRNNELIFDLNLVSRVNKYGDMPHCVIDINYYLGKWCVCYDKI